MSDFKMLYYMEDNGNFIGSRTQFRGTIYDMDPNTTSLILTEFDVDTKDTEYVTPKVNSKGEYYIHKPSEDYPVTDYNALVKALGYTYRIGTDLQLKVLYHQYNKKYFNNELTHDIILNWNTRMTTTAGRARYKCKYSGRVVNSVYQFSIELSLHYHKIHPKDLTPVLLHEMIHIKYPLTGHKDFFHMELERLRRLGVNPARYSQEVYDIEQDYKYLYTCLTCGQLFYRMRMVDTTRYHCPCRGRLKLIDTQ